MNTVSTEKNDIDETHLAFTRRLNKQRKKKDI